MKSLLCGIASFGFILSLVVHVSTYFHLSLPDKIPQLRFLHIGILVLFIPFILDANSAVGKSKKSDFWRTLFRDRPQWVLAIVQVLMVYAIVNFLLGFYLSRGGVPDTRGGRKVLHSHGKIIRTLSEEEYAQQRALLTRMLSGHWLLFYSLPALYYGTGARRRDIRTC